MSLFDLNYETWLTKGAGLLGAAVSMQFLQGSFFTRLTMALGGMVASYYAAPPIASRTGLPEGLAGFLLGLFGMAIISRVWEWIQTAPIGAIWQALIDRLRGKAKDKDPTP